MDGDIPGWARGVLLTVTAVPHEERAALRDLIEGAGGRYSPNLSQRCTHLAVPRAALKARGTCSHKLQSAVRHEHRWGLHIVDLAWLHECNSARRRLDEAPFRPPAELLAALAPSPQQEQAPPNARAAVAPTSGSSCVLAAQTRPHPSWQAARSSAACTVDTAAGSQPCDAARRSINSRPLSSFGAAQPAASLQTQAPSIQRSLQLTTGRAASCAAAVAAEELGVAAAWARGSAAAAAAPPAQAGQLPDAVRGCDASPRNEGGDQPDFGRLQMTQAGFMPAADLVARLCASSHAAPPGRPAAAAADAARPLQQGAPLPRPQQCSQQQSSGQARAAEGAARPAEESRAEGQMEQRRRVGGAPSCAAAGEAGTGAAAAAAERLLQPESRLSSADLAEQLRLAASGLGVRPPSWQQAVQGAQALPPGQHVAAEESLGAAQPEANAVRRTPGLPTADLLDQLRALGGCAADAGGQRERGEASQAGGGRAGLEELLSQLRTCGPVPVTAPAQLLRQGQERGLESPAAGPSPRRRQRPGAASGLHLGSTPLTGGACSLLTQQATAPGAAGCLPMPSSSLPGQPEQHSGAAVQREQAGRSADGAVPLLLRQQDSSSGQQLRTATPLVHPSAVEAAACTPPPDRGASTAHLAAQLRALAQQSTFTPLLGDSSTCAPPERRGRAAEQHSTLERGAPGRAGQAAAASAARSAALQLPTAALRGSGSTAGGGEGSEGSGLQAKAEFGGGVDVAPAASPAGSAASPAVQAASARARQASKSSIGEAPQPAPAASSQVSDSGGSSGGVFAGMLAVLDPGLPAEEQQRVVAALQAGGGGVGQGGGLCQGVTHVVCPPEAALRWLALGVGIVSPQWVLQSLRSGQQQRCLTVSADTSRHLPQGSPQAPLDAAPANASMSGALLASREARQRALGQLEGACGPPGAGGSVASCGPPHQPGAAPSLLLCGLHWSVLDAPSGARRERQQPDPGTLIVPDSEDEEEASRCCFTASQACVAEVLREAAPALTAASGAAATAQPALPQAWLGEVALRGPALVTLLLPRDARGELGLATLDVPAAGCGRGRQLTAGQLLQAVHGYYQQEMGCEEQLQTLRDFPEAAAAAALRPAFLELAPVLRGALLGSRCSFEGLRRATVDPGGAVYEVLLGS